MQTDRLIARAALLLVALLTCVIPESLANSNPGPAGLTNRDGPGGVGTGCTGCHGTGGVNTGITVTITGPALLSPNQLGTYTVTATRTITNGTKMGVNVAASDTPTPLSVVAGMPMVAAGSRELVHTTAGATQLLRTITSNSANYTFNYTMPAAAVGGSTHTLYAAAQVGPSGTGGGYNHAPNFTVTTIPNPPTSATASGPTSSTVNLSWNGGGPEYRVLYKAGAAASSSPTDGTQAFNGAGTSTTVTGLSPSTQYTFSVFSKNAAATVFSATPATATSTTTAAPAAARHVNAATGSNTSNNCTVPASPCKTVTYAMSQAAAGSPGDTINIAPGVYNIALGEVFPISVKSGTQLISTGAPGAAILDALGDTVKQGILVISGNASTNTRVEGLTLRFGIYQAPQGGVATGGALRISGGGAAPTITRNVLTGNQALGFNSDGTSGTAGGIATGGALNIATSPAIVTNNVFNGNAAAGGNGQTNPAGVSSGRNGGIGQGGAIFSSGTGSIANNTFYANRAVGGTGGSGSNGQAIGGLAQSGAVSTINSPGPSIDNNIFHSNATIGGAGGTQGPATAGAVVVQGSAPSQQKNVFFANTLNGGASSGDTMGTAPLLSNPLLQFPPNNLKLIASSPAVGAGLFAAAPAIDFEGTPRPNPPAIGAFEAYSLNPIEDFDHDNIPNGVEFAEGRNPLVMDNDVFTNARLFAMQQYRDFLAREGDPGGITFYTNGITGGTMPRSQVIENFFLSPEFGGIVAPVTRLYFAFFNRIPDYPGLLFQVNAYRTGTPLAVIASNFAASPEFIATYGSLNNTQYVTLLYQNVLGRTPVQTEIDFYVNLLTTGTSRGQVMLNFSESPEYQNLKFNAVYVTNMYVGMLRRAPEQAGFDFWVAYMAGGSSGQALIAGFLNAPEYHNRFLP